ncbi:MAG: hypothetical protein ACFFE8_07370 [Candidatus Heimdallarchaeota archaeon]
MGKSVDIMTPATIKKTEVLENPFLTVETQNGFECLITSMLAALDVGLGEEQIIRNVKSVIEDLELIFEGELEESVRSNLANLTRKHLLRQDVVGDYWMSENGRVIGSELLSRFRLKLVGC